MKAASACLLLLTLVAAGASAEYPSGVRQFGYYVSSGGGGFSVENFTWQNQTAYLISSGGEPLAIMVQFIPFLPHQPITDRGQIESALFSYYLSQGFEPELLLGMSPVHEGLANLSERRRPGTAKCRVMLGTDRFKCDSLETCQKACYAVTSFCLPIALGSGMTFIQVMLDFEESNNKLEAAFISEQGAYSEMAANQSKQSALAYLSAIGEINKAATRASQSALYDGYSYCFAPDYALADLTGLQLSAQNHYRSVLHFLDMPQTAAAVLNRTLTGLDVQAKYTLPIKQKNQTAQANITPPAGNAASASEERAEPLPDLPSAHLDFSLLAAPAALIVIAAAALYLASRKKGGLYSAGEGGRAPHRKRR